MNGKMLQVQYFSNKNDAHLCVSSSPSMCSSMVMFSCVKRPVSSALFANSNFARCSLSKHNNNNYDCSQSFYVLQYMSVSVMDPQCSKELYTVIIFCATFPVSDILQALTQVPMIKLILHL